MIQRIVHNVIRKMYIFFIGVIRKMYAQTTQTVCYEFNYIYIYIEREREREVKVASNFNRSHINNLNFNIFHFINIKFIERIINKINLACIE